MPPKQRIASPTTILERQIRVQSIAAHVSHRAEKPRGLPPRFEGGPWLEVRGTADEPVRDVREVAISVHFHDLEVPGATNPPSVGGIIQIRPEIRAVVYLPAKDFDRVWTMTMSGQLRYCWMAFTEPHRQYAHVVNASFSNQSEE